jgi:hypothetical protein
VATSAIIGLFFTGVADQITAQATQNKAQTDSIFSNIAKQLSDTAVNLLGNQDPAKVDQLQSSVNSVLSNTNSLRAELEKQGEAVQATFSDILSKLYGNTLETAKNVATQLDAAQKKN